MTISTAVARFDTLYPNQFSYAEKLSWLSALDGTVFNEIISLYEGAPGSFSGYTVSTPDTTVLLVSFPHDDLYIKYLNVCINEVMGDAGRYNNSVAIFNNSYQAFANMFNRSHRLKSTATVSV